jgi:hypothetical protein
MSIATKNGLKITEILKLLPEFTTIADIKENLVDTLMQYNTQLSHLTQELDHSTNASSLIRQDIQNLKSR